jgi:hypothetical protein
MIRARILLETLFGCIRFHDRTCAQSQNLRKSDGVVFSIRVIEMSQNAVCRVLLGAMVCFLCQPDTH